MNKAKKEMVERLLKLRQTIKTPSKINILALDQATTCGVAFQTVEMGVEYGFESWDLSKKTKESDGIKWLRFESYIEKKIKDLSIQIIAYELPGGQHTGAIIHSSKMIGIIERLCAKNGIEYIETSSKTIKKFATGNGNANKEMMVEAARIRLGYDGSSHDEADALWMLFYVKSQFL